MRRGWPLLSILGLFFSQMAPAARDVSPIFTIWKPDNSANLVQVIVGYDTETCKLGGIDFIWLRNSPHPEFQWSEKYKAWVKTPNEMLHCAIMKRLETRPVPAGSKVACKALPATLQCSDLSVYAEEFNKIDGPPAVVVRSVKSASSGKCQIAAYADMGDSIAQVRQVRGNGSVSQSLLSKTVNFTNIQIFGMTDNNPVLNKNCQRGCRETFGLSSLCRNN